MLKLLQEMKVGVAGHDDHVANGQPAETPLDHLCAIESITCLSEYLVQNADVELGDRDTLYLTLIRAVRNHALESIKALTE